MFTSYIGDVLLTVNLCTGSFLAIGTQGAEVQLWDTERLKQVRNMKGHKARVGSLAWNEYMLSSGSRDSAIHNHDVRVAQHHISTLEAHRQEVCGLKWCQEGRQLASGGNDNLLHIWDVGRNTPRFTLENHQVLTPTHSMCACLLHGYPDSKYLVCYVYTRIWFVSFVLTLLVCS